MFYIRKIKWSPKKVVISDFGPFKEREEAKLRLTTVRKHKSTEYSIVEKDAT